MSSQASPGIVILPLGQDVGTGGREIVESDIESVVFSTLLIGTLLIFVVSIVGGNVKSNMYLEVVVRRLLITPGILVGPGGGFVALTGLSVTHKVGGNVVLKSTDVVASLFVICVGCG